MFLDHDDINDINATFDIEGEDYKRLLICALSYCKYFSLDYPDNMSPLDSLAPYIHRIENIDRYKESWELCEACNWYEMRVFYHYNEETKHILEELTNSIFKYFYYFYGTPENPTFYRDDYSIFFSSVTHEGDSFLFPQNNENVDVLLSNKHWQEIPSQN